MFANVKQDERTQPKRFFFGVSSYFVLYSVSNLTAMQYLKPLIFIPMIFLASAIKLTAQDPAAYRIFDATGKPSSYEAMIAAGSQAEVVFFGELHNNAIAHWLELKVGESLFAKRGKDLVLGSEMFEADNQLLLDEYWQDKIPTKTFEEETRIWKNYATDYKPLVEWAKTNELPFIATNIPRRYANLVFRNGIAALDSLSKTARTYLMPLPVKIDYELPGYKAMGEMMGGHGSSEKLIAAQAVKDATMAHFLLQNWKTGQLFYHLNGSYHSENKEGIIWYLRQQQPSLKITTLATVEQDELNTLDAENTGKADFIIVIPMDMTKTY